MNRFFTVLSIFAVFALGWTFWPETFVFTGWDAVILTTIFYVAAYWIIAIVLTAIVAAALALARILLKTSSLWAALCEIPVIVILSLAVVDKLYAGFEFNGSFGAFVFTSLILAMIHLPSGESKGKND